MRLSYLRDKEIRTLDGKKLGRVHEVHCENGKVTALIAGPGGLIESWTDKGHGRRIPWEFVRKIDAKRILVTPDPPRRSTKPDASRSRQGTPRPTGRPSKR